MGEKRPDSEAHHPEGERPVPRDITTLIESSGNSFHAKVARWFSDHEWHVVISPYYMDQAQNKAREIDLVAEKLWPVDNVFGQRIGSLAVRLFVECKYVPSHSVFWFADKDRASAEELVCSGGIYRERNRETNDHHYLSQGSKVAKLFATSGNKSTENDPFYKALNQTLNAMVAMRGQAVSIPSIKHAQEAPSPVIEFPMVVCSSFDQMYEVDFFSDSEPGSIENNFQLEVRYAYIDGKTQRNDYFLIDFVEFGQLDHFEDSIDNDARIAAFFESDN